MPLPATSPGRPEWLPPPLLPSSRPSWAHQEPPDFLLLAGGSSLILGFPYPKPCFFLFSTRGEISERGCCSVSNSDWSHWGPENRLKQENLNMALPFPNPQSPVPPLGDGANAVHGSPVLRTGESPQSNSLPLGPQFPHQQSEAVSWASPSAKVCRSNFQRASRRPLPARRAHRG